MNLLMPSSLLLVLGIYAVFCETVLPRFLKYKRPVDLTDALQQDVADSAISSARSCLW